MQASHEYDVAFSFAGEDRDYVDEVAGALKNSGIRVFYDRYEQIDLWGKDLYTHLRDVYQKKARYTVMFISQSYARKLWTNHERESAQARAFTENREYVLPVRFDDTDVPGVLPTTGYLDLRNLSPVELANAIVAKLGKTIVPERNEEPEPADEPYIAPSEGPVIVWRMPRGFLLLEDIITQPYDSWAVTLEHYGYDGFDHYGTHYHESYGRYWDEVEGMEIQYRKLQLPLADWRFAFGALDLARDIRHGRIVVDSEGSITKNGRPYAMDDYRAAIYPSGVVPPQQVPQAYVGLKITGPLRDIVAELETLLAPEWRRTQPADPNIPETAKTLRRLARVEISKVFEVNHPARLNVEEVIGEFSRTWSVDEMKKWLDELAQALREASAEIRGQYEPAGGV